ncbi:DUF1684 domain-containing protein [Amycolatopsis sp. NPDC051903]|uniref:DUF1684 domain-containing protein n=1 Tax=Amycolatopsis sp. NPDC051903 TaxID=3363936 RepID=UPI0037B8ADA7
MTASTQDFTRAWEDWKADREKELAAPHGWLAIISLDWLDEQPREYPGVPGKWWQDEEAAYVDPAGADLEYEGEPVTGVRRFELVNSGPTVRVVAGAVEVEVARRTGYLLRVHDPEAPVLKNFRGIPAYAPDEQWVVDGRFEPFAEPRPVTVGAVVEGLSHVYTAPGVVRFTHDGTEHALTAFAKPDGALMVLFADATSGVTTYAANRSLQLGKPDDRGRVRLDFTRAVNLPCAFIDFATCPLPPEGNRLPFAVEAGEKLPYERQG